MNELTKHLLAREREFIVGCETNNEDEIAGLIYEELRKNYAVLTEITGIKFSIADTPQDGLYQITFCLDYDDEKTSGPVFVVKTEDEFFTAVSLVLKMHIPGLRMVIDNEAGSFVPEDVGNMLEDAYDRSGVDEAIFQIDRREGKIQSVYDFIIIRCTFEYFESIKEINEARVVVAERANLIRKKTRSAEGRIAEIAEWFHRNFKYRKTDKLADHSFASFIKTHEGVCQAITVCADLMLEYCGIESLFVGGEGSNGGEEWEAHSWNLINLNNKWIHADFVPAVSNGCIATSKSESSFRKGHRWDEKKYNPDEATLISQMKKQLKESEVVFYPDKMYFTVNDCYVDMSCSDMPCILANRTAYISLDFLVAFYDGCYGLNPDSLVFHLDTHRKSLPRAGAFLQNGDKLYIDVFTLENLGFTISASRERISIRKTERF